ncbi:hypothetical protein, partial [Nocardioides alcanivorans]|uniref:hypothetical protein n=1 Tax=Nocardioides alcanivorans TaxID=2897352 RepID=UPI001F2DAEEC
PVLDPAPADHRRRRDRAARTDLTRTSRPRAPAAHHLAGAGASGRRATSYRAELNALIST